MIKKLLIIGSFLLGTSGTVFASFSDVSSIHPDSTAINYLQAQNIISGSEDGKFHPELGLTRCELTKIALKTSNISLVTPQSSIFPDLPTSNWCHAYAYTARSNGILQGYPDGTFKPNNKVTEIEALKIILNSLQLRLPSVTQNLYQDVRATDWWAPYILYVRNFNLSALPNGDYYGIHNEFLRAKMARVLYRGLQVKQTNQPFSTTTSSSDFESELDSIDETMAELDEIDFDSFN
ncbi:MAG: S-layer homology domain-containing protein [Candidatus Abawacabacteria bacterium]|nr:S-layer homology domain-containing protein [Candidatus Abawacabacteria bacterium]